MTILEIKFLCRKFDLVPTKFRGQNFLFDQNIVAKIISAAKLSPADKVLEVGPGLGVLTTELLKYARQVMAVELDKKIVSFLKVKFFKEIASGRLILISGDILKFNPALYQLNNFQYKIVANLPYNITAIFLRNFLAAAVKPNEMILMVQKEVAQRIVAQPGQMSLLALSAQFYSQPEILFQVRAECFWPKPQVDSAVISLKLNKKLPEIDAKKFFRLVRLGFSAKRKKLINNLAGGLGGDVKIIKEIFKTLNLDENIRAQSLSLEQWLEVCRLTPP